LGAKRCLGVLYPRGYEGLRGADLGCLEGGYSVELARLGFREVVGIEVRKANFDKCRFVKERLAFTNLTFVNDDVWNLERYGIFDVVFCCGLLYHLDRPKQFLHLLASQTRRALLIKTATAHDSLEGTVLPEVTTHEGLRGRWFSEAPIAKSETALWASWENTKSFWPEKGCLIEAIRAVGFPMVFEQFDALGEIPASLKGRTSNRSMLVGLKTQES
jgi:SAM-dependent methyltransferase